MRSQHSRCRGPVFSRLRKEASRSVYSRACDLCDRCTVVRGSHGGIARGDDGLLRIAGLELFRQGAVDKLATDFGGLETVAVVGKLQSVDFALPVLHALDREAAPVELVEEHGVARQTFSRDACRAM